MSQRWVSEFDMLRLTEAAGRDDETGAIAAPIELIHWCRPKLASGDKQTSASKPIPLILIKASDFGLYHIALLGT